MDLLYLRIDRKITSGFGFAMGYTGGMVSFVKPSFQ
jgi:hypothetical protein